VPVQVVFDMIKREAPCMGNSGCYEFGKFDASRVNRVVIIYVCKACAFHAKPILN
jgi:hypothetical protein